MERKRLAMWIVAVVLAVATVTAIVPAVALTGWKTFAWGSGWGRGPGGHPGVDVAGSTLPNPEVVRFTVESKWGIAPTDTVSVYWYIDCFDEPEWWNGVSASGNFDTTLPLDKEITEVPVANWERCQLSVSVYYYDAGNLLVRLQSRHP